MAAATEKMGSVDLGNSIDKALRIAKAVRDALLAEREAFEKLSVPQQERALMSAFDLLDLLADLDQLARARMGPLQVAHRNATALSRLPGEKSH